MAKVIVLASGADADAVNAALEAASLDFEVVEPTASNLLHIVIGMVGDEPKEEEEPKEPKEPKEEPSEEESTPEDVPSEEVQESLGMIRVNGELMRAVKKNSRDSFLNVNTLIAGPKTSYIVNESTFSFWPADVANPMQRVLVEHETHKVSVEVHVRNTTRAEPYITIGADLASLFPTK